MTYPHQQLVIRMDKLYEKLQTMEKAQGWKDHDSPTVKSVVQRVKKLLIHTNYITTKSL